MNNICFVNVSFGERYVLTQKRLKDSILRIYPDATLFFWTDELPPNSKSFQESLYGFKVHAIQYARDKGYTKIVWIDTCAVLKGRLEHLFETNFIAVQDDNKLYRFSGMIPIHNKEWHLVGGSLYLFDFEKDVYINIFNEWAKMEAAGDFGTQNFVMQEKNDGIEKCGHRMDETCMAIALYINGLEPESGTLYRQVIEKQHFLKEGEKWYNS